MAQLRLGIVISGHSAGQPQPKVQAGERFHDSGGTGCAWQHVDLALLLTRDTQPCCRCLHQTQEALVGSP